MADRLAKGGHACVAAPKFARVDIDTLRALRKLAENEPALADKLDHLIEAAEERAWPL